MADRLNVEYSEAHRFNPPARLGNEIERDALIQRLQTESSAAITLLCAPPGYGKATLLAQFADRLRGGGHLPIWINVQRSDRDPATFLQLLIAALQHFDIVQSSCVAGIVDEERFFAEVVRLIVAREQPTFVLLNDCELLHGSETEPMLARLAGRLFPQLRFVFSTNGRPPQAFSSLAARGLINRIDGSALRFEPGEIEQLVGRSLRASEWQRLERDGWHWPVALAFLNRSRTNGVELDFDGRALLDTVDDYICSEVLGRLPEAGLRFLIEVSVLDSLDLEAVIEIRAEEEAGWLLELARDLGDLLEENDARMTLNPLLRAALRKKFLRLPAQRASDIKIAAALRATRVGDHWSALEGAIAARRPDVAAEILNSIGPARLWMRFGLKYMSDALELVPAVYRERYPRLQLGEIIALFMKGRIAQACRAFAELRVSTMGFTAAGSGSGSDPAELRFDASLVETLSVLYEDIISAPVLSRIERELRAMIGGDFNELESNIRCLELINTQQCGDFSKSPQFIELVRKAYTSLNSDYGNYFINIYDGCAQFCLNSTNSAITSFEFATSINKTQLNGGAELSCLSQIMRAEALYEQGDWSSAQALIDEYLPWLERSIAWYDFLASGYGTAAALALRRNGVAAALGELQRARALCEDRRSSCLKRLIPLMELDIVLAAGDMPAAREIVQRDGLEQCWKTYEPDLNQTAWRERDLLFGGMSRYYIALNDLGAAASCIELMRRDANSTGRRRSILICNLLACALLWRKGARVRATSLLGALLDDAVVSGRWQLIRSHARLLKPVIEQLSHNIEPSSELAALLGELNQTAPENNPALGGYKLTMRERHILRLVGEGESNKAIARRLQLSENTIKYHLKRVSTKMKAYGSGRIELAQRAQIDGLA